MRSPCAYEQVPNRADPKDYRKRKWITEPPNGWIKNVLGFRQFSMRDLDKANAEFKRMCLTLNLRRIGAMKAV